MSRQSKIESLKDDLKSMLNGSEIQNCTNPYFRQKESNRTSLNNNDQFRRDGSKILVNHMVSPTYNDT